MAIIKLQDIRKVYPLGKLEVEAVKKATFEINKGEFAVISGPSGSGKSTILNMIGLIDVPTSGYLEINGTDIYEGYLETKQAAKAAKKGVLPAKADNRITSLRHSSLGFIFQTFNLIPVLNVYENIEFPLLLGKTSINGKERTEWINYLIEKVGLTEWKTHRPNELSGGQRQRAAIARALVTKAPIILADEPTANLDSKNGDQILSLMKDLNKELQTTFVFSTHDAKIVDMADHLIKLLDGEIVLDEYRNAKPAEV